MKVLSVNVAQARPIKIGGRDVMTGIFKEPVRGRVRARRHSLDGDVQADQRVHGGEVLQLCRSIHGAVTEPQRSFDFTGLIADPPRSGEGRTWTWQMFSRLLANNPWLKEALPAYYRWEQEPKKAPSPENLS